MSKIHIIADWKLTPDTIDGAINPYVMKCYRLPRFLSKTRYSPILYTPKDIKVISDQQWYVGVRKRIYKNWENGDAIGTVYGRRHNPFAEHFSRIGPVFELSVTHRSFRESFCAFESQWITKTHRLNKFDTIIPNCYFLEEFNEAAVPDDYLLFLGRYHPDKGLSLISELAKKIDLPIICAGYGDTRLLSNVKNIGVVSGQEKRELLNRATAVLTPSQNREPFCGVSIEAMMSGTPTLATDWGVFKENIVNGVNGFRCNDLSDFRAAITICQKWGLDKRKQIQIYANQHWGEEVAQKRYASWFNDMYGR
jgi:glycosyltransferase involved in cell wall biosynthesis